MTGSSIANQFAGMSYGLQEKLKNKEVPWGAGGNFDETSYGRKWIEKTDKGASGKGGSYLAGSGFDALDHERERLESQQQNRDSAGGNMPQDGYNQPPQELAGEYGN